MAERGEIPRRGGFDGHAGIFVFSSLNRHDEAGSGSVLAARDAHLSGRRRQQLFGFRFEIEKRLRGRGRVSILRGAGQSQTKRRSKQNGFREDIAFCGFHGLSPNPRRFNAFYRQHSQSHVIRRPMLAIPQSRAQSVFAGLKNLLAPLNR